MTEEIEEESELRLVHIKSQESKWKPKQHPGGEERGPEECDFEFVS